ncbi:MAG TPA: DUF4386 domain-containing protein [Bacteroidia bacterium]|nr:DUF4386 domain-containing protein [Bacteroidia bacterium]HNP98346.1 DUF4386 domain-containing protein [Bacteroidia bacterium]
MNTYTTTPSELNAPHSSGIVLPRKTSLYAGLFYLLTFISVPTLFLYESIHTQDYLMSNSSDRPVVIGGILEIIVALSGIATAVIFYPLLKKQNQSLAIGLVAARIVEAGTMFVGFSFLLGAVFLHEHNATVSNVPLAQTLVAMYDRIFVLGQGFMPAIDDILIGTLLYQSRLIPRKFALLGIVGAFALLAGYFGIMFGYFDRMDPLSGASALMVATFEFSLGIYLLIKGLRK